MIKIMVESDKQKFIINSLNFLIKKKSIKQGKLAIFYQH